jgi:hypothetical protein
MTTPKILSATWPYFQKVLTYHGLDISPMSDKPCTWGGDQQKVKGFTDYNFILDLNLCLSESPRGLVRDITGSIKFPFLTEPGLLWTIPTSNPNLEFCFKNRVKEIEKNYQTVNLMWSGGIDSTSMVVAWLQYASCHTHIRVLYSIDSIKENANFFLHLQTVKHIELIEIGGRTFYNNNLNGIEIHGASGDYITASVDESFFKNYGWYTLQLPWKEFFWKKNPDQNFIDFCDRWFALSGREIFTVLEARWWLYLNKMGPSNALANIVTSESPAAISFFSDSKFVSYFYHRIDTLFSSTTWNSYKQDFKDFIYNYHPDEHYQKNKCKETSGGYSIFANKSAILNSNESICVLSDFKLIQTDHLPFLSNYEYRKKYNNRLNYLFDQNEI